MGNLIFIPLVLGGYIGSILHIGFGLAFLVENWDLCGDGIKTWQIVSFCLIPAIIRLCTEGFTDSQIVACLVPTLSLPLLISGAVVVSNVQGDCRDSNLYDEVLAMCISLAIFCVICVAAGLCSKFADGEEHNDESVPEEQGVDEEQ